MLCQPIGMMYVKLLTYDIYIYIFRNIYLMYEKGKFAILELDLCVASAAALESNPARLLALAIAISTSDH